MMATRRRPYRSKTSSGFTLIELLAAMTTLVVLVLMLTRLFTQGIAAMETGNRNTYRNMNARAVMDFMARELSVAIFEYGNDPDKQFLSMGYNEDPNPGIQNFGLKGADELYFIKSGMDPNRTWDQKDKNESRSIEFVRYYMATYLRADGSPITRAPLHPEFRFRLMRESHNPSLTGRYSAYFDTTGNDAKGLFWFGLTDAARPPLDPQTQKTMVDGVRTFKVFTYTDSIGNSVTSWRSFNNDRLAFMDLYLETMDETDAARISLLANQLAPNHPTVVELAERSVKRNYRRVFLYNKQGYYDVDW